MAKKKKTKKFRPSAVRSDTPVYDRLVVEIGFAPHNYTPGQDDDFRYIPAQDRMLEDNFS